LAAGGWIIPHAQRLDCACYGKVDLACQATGGAGQPSGTVVIPASAKFATGAIPGLRAICTRIRKF